MLAVALVKRLPAKLAVTREMAPRLADTGHLMINSTVGLIGLGNIGQGVARRLQGWETRLVAADPYVKPEVASILGVELMDLDSLLATADVVSVMVTLTDETRYLIGERELALRGPA